MVGHEIVGDDMQAVVLRLAHGDEVRAEAGAMMYMTDNIDMDSKMEGGLLGGLKRSIPGVSPRSIPPWTTTSSGSAESRRRSSAARGCSSRR
jgi:uncharacterized protein (AIM24 family)